MHFTQILDAAGNRAVQAVNHDVVSSVTLTALPDGQFRLGTQRHEQACVLSEDVFLALATSSRALARAAQDAGVQNILASDPEYGLMIRAVGGVAIEVRRAGQPRGALLEIGEFIDLAADPYLAIQAAKEAADLAVTDTSLLYAMEASGSTAALIHG